MQNDVFSSTKASFKATILYSEYQSLSAVVIKALTLISRFKVMQDVRTVCAKETNKKTRSFIFSLSSTYIINQSQTAAHLLVLDLVLPDISLLADDLE